MEIYRTEEEQVEAIQTWWKENAVAIVAGIVIGIAVIAGYRYWTETKITQAENASLLFSETVELKNTDDKKFNENTEKLLTEFSDTPYAALIALHKAKRDIEKNETEKAITSLTWILDNSGEESVQHIARQRLVRLYIDKSNYDKAENLLAGVKAAGFASAYDELRGDLHFANKQPVQAKENYRLALASMSQSDPRYALVKMKLENIAVDSIEEKNK